MKSLIVLILAIWVAILVQATCTPAIADVVYLKNGSVLFGRIESIEQEVLVLQVRIPSSSSTDSIRYRTQQIPLSEILTSVKTVKEERLSLLNPTNPESYRDLADEVAIQRMDPEARDLAIRLYLLAAFQEKQKFDETFIVRCFDQLISLARSHGEEKRFRALAQTVTKSDRNWLIIKSESNAIVASSEGSSRNESPNTEEQRRLLLRAVRLIRRGQADQASMIVNEPWAKAALIPFASTCDWFGLREILASRELNVKQLARLVELEVLLSQPELHKSEVKRANWSRIVPESKSRRSTNDSKISSVYPVHYQNVSEFDLGKSIYRDGQWVVPPSDAKVK